MCEQVRAISVFRLKARVGRLAAPALRMIEDKLKIALDLE